MLVLTVGAFLDSNSGLFTIHLLTKIQIRTRTSWMGEHGCYESYGRVYFFAFGLESKFKTFLDYFSIILCINAFDIQCGIV